VNVLILHNRYRGGGGEDRSARDIATLLRERGHVAEVLERSSETLTGPGGYARAGAAMLRGGVDPDEVTRAARDIGADVVHAHNVHPLWGVRALEAARAAGAAVVMHLHNYRLFCSIGIHYRDGGICTLCRDRNVLPGVRHRCRGNLPEAAVYGAGLWRQQPRLLAAVDRFIAPSAFAADRLAAQGLARERISVAHNFLPAGDFSPAPRDDPPQHALFAGRLVEEKGVETAMTAAEMAGVPLAFAGAGPAADRIRPPARHLGVLDRGAMRAALERAAFVVVPSRWDEPCPYSVIEAMAAGIPVLASARGGLPEMVGEQHTLPDRDVEAWASAMRRLWDDAGLRRERAVEALARARRLFTAERFYATLMDAYAAAGAR
jgi:glycosyltransferase involved in cell wall biosynthesis